MVTQHNIRIISKYYSQLTLQRMSALIRVAKDYCEEELCVLNNEKVINCRVNRTKDTVDFKPVEYENSLLGNWNSSINQILEMVDVTSNLINREREIYGK
jgi:26S proteasome regulatory subunit N5